MKKLCVLLLIFVLIMSVSAASYTQSAADVSPGAFPDGMYTFPDQLLVGATSASRDASLYVEESDKTYPIYAFSTDITNPAIFGGGSGKGVTGMTTSTSTSNAAVYGLATSGAPAVYGYDTSGSGIGVKAYSTNYGFYTSGADYGIYVPDAGIVGGRFVGDSYGVYAVSDSIGVYANADYTGGYFIGGDTGVIGQTSSTTSYECGVKGYNSVSENVAYLGCYNNAIYASGNGRVTGALTVGSCSGCDVAEHFLGDGLEPGDVVVLDSSALRGVRKTTTAYDKLAAGIVSTDPTITMGLKEGVPIALSGVVPTKVIGKINVGDLLTTSTTAGYAMACSDYTKCAGAIIGKAMENNAAGKGKITALVMLG
jgi:hypothetical protein